MPYTNDYERQALRIKETNNWLEYLFGDRCRFYTTDIAEIEACASSLPEFMFPFIKTDNTIDMTDPEFYISDWSLSPNEVGDEFCMSHQITVQNFMEKYPDDLMIGVVFSEESQRFQIFYVPSGETYFVVDNVWDEYYQTLEELSREDY